MSLIFWNGWHPSCRTSCWLPIVLPMFDRRTRAAPQRRAATSQNGDECRDYSAGFTRRPIALAFMGRSDRAPAPPSACAAGNWQAPFGIVLAVDRLTALMLVLTLQHRAGIQLVLHGALAQGRGALSPIVSAAVDGLVRRFPHCRLVQSIRLLRDHAGGILWPAAAWLWTYARAIWHALHSPSTWQRLRCS